MKTITLKDKLSGKTVKLLDSYTGSSLPRDYQIPSKVNTAQLVMRNSGKGSSYGRALSAKMT